MRNAASSQVDTEASGAVSLVYDDLAGPVPRSARAGAGSTDPFQQRACADTVVALAGSRQNRERTVLAVAGEVNLGRHATSGPAEDVIVRFVLPMPPLCGRWRRVLVGADDGGVNLDQPVDVADRVGLGLDLLQGP